jgi:energy-coupling factor transport system permease protein
MDERTRIRFHPLVWPLWLLAGALLAGSNPLHNVLVLLGAALVALACHSDSPVGRAFPFFVRIGLVVVVLRAALSTVAVGGVTFGQTPLGRLPEARLPWWLGGLALGGPFTLEMVAYGLVSGVRLLTILAVFGAFNAAADHYGLLRRTPGFLRGAGLAVTIALAFVPQTLTQLAAIREAQRVRGHRFRTWRDALPLLVPLISGGIERSLQLAEAMDSRGYGWRTGAAARRPGWEQVATLGGLTLLALGLFSLFYAPDARAGLLELVVAIVLLGAVARSLGRATQHSRYLREPWRRRDVLVASSSALLIVGGFAGRRLAPDAFTYLTYPRAEAPVFHPASIGLLLLLVVPAVVTLALEEQGRRALRREPAAVGQ